MARMRNGYLREAVTITETHVGFVRLARAHDKVIAYDQQVVANLLITIITARSRKRLIKHLWRVFIFFFSLKASNA